MKRYTVLMAIACLCLIVLTVFGRQPQQTPPFVVWEYKQSCTLKESEMNRLGAEGWELVASGATGGTIDCLYYKRPKR